MESGISFLTLSAMISEDDRQCSTAAIEFSCNNDTLIVKAELFTSQFVGNLTGLSPFKKYKCFARVVNKNGLSERTEVQVFATKQDGKLQLNV